MGRRCGGGEEVRNLPPFPPVPTSPGFSYKGKEESGGEKLRDFPPLSKHACPLLQSARKRPRVPHIEPSGRRHSYPSLLAQVLYDRVHSQMLVAKGMFAREGNFLFAL